MKLYEHSRFERARLYERGTDVDVAVRRRAYMNRDELQGQAEALKGKVKQAAGDLTDDPELHDEGVGDEAAGKTQETIGRAKRKAGEAIEDFGKKVKGA
jgi:uncharacterized protein YjbJ (UPF0337 family)